MIVMSPKKRKFTRPTGTNAICCQKSTVAWEAWRAENLVRCPGLNGQFRGGCLGKRDQKPFHIYKAQKQTWLMVPFISRVEGDGAQSLTGTKLFRYKVGAHVYEHYTDIHRIAALANSHPVVQSVQTHKAHKALDASMRDEKGWATRFDQSPHDLSITLAASGATFHCGVTANAVHKDLLSMWFHRGKTKKKDAAVLETIAVVFYDLCEVDRQRPTHIPAEYWSQPTEPGAFQTIWADSLSNMF